MKTTTRMLNDRSYYRSHPLLAARYMLPAVGALVHLYGSTGAHVLAEVVRRLREVPCTSAAIRQVLAELREEPLSRLEADHGIDPENARVFARSRERLLNIPTSFWEQVYQKLDEANHKPNPRRTA